MADVEHRVIMKQSGGGRGVGNNHRKMVMTGERRKRFNFLVIMDICLP